MRRRRVLATIGTTAVASVAGCAGGSDASTPEPTPPIDGQDCPPYDVDHDGAVCSHTVDPEETAVYLDATPATASLDGGTPASEVTLTLYNQATGEFTFNPYTWTISKKADSGWEPLEEQIAGDAWVTVAGGETYTWSFVEAVEAIRTDPALDPGLYAAEIGVPDPESSEAWIACIALVRLTTAT